MKTKIERDPSDMKPAMRMNVVDRVVSFFNPEGGIQRMVARNQLHAFGYNDVPERRGRSGGMYGNAGSENYTKSRDRLKAMWDARDLCQYDWIGGVLGRVTLYTVGQLHCKSVTGDEEINKMYDDDFHAWCGDQLDDDGFTRCDITGRNRLIKLVQMAFLAHLVDGDHGIVEVAPQESPNGEYCLQLVQADRIGSPLEAQVQENYISGVGLDPQTGRVAFYRVFQRTRTNQYVNPREIPPNAFIHVMDQDRPDEYRGRTKLLRLLNDVRDIREWVEAEKIAGKTQSQFAALIGVKDPYSSTGPGAWSGKTDAGTLTQDAQWGKILKLAEGESFSMLSPSARPSGAFLAFVQTLIRKAAVSLDLPYEFLWDMAGLGGVNSRIVVQQALRRIQYWQQNIIVNRIVNRVRNHYIASRIAIGALPPHPNWQKCEWHFGPWISTDVGYEMDADLRGASSGILPISMLTGKYGYSPEEVFQSNASVANTAIAVGTETQVPAEVFAGGLFPNLTEQKAAFIQGPPPPPPPGSVEAVGEKGAKEILDTLAKVTTGELDRDAAVNALVTIYNLPQPLAEAIVPKQAAPQKEEKHEDADPKA